MPATLALLTHLAAVLLVGAVLVASGQPILTDDLWWHLALGERYAEHGPWLDADPLLFTAVRPPTPSAWLSDVALHGVLTTFGFAGLRVLHVAIVATIFGAAWWLLRRASRSAVVASAGIALFATLSAFRLFQLRPHLATVLCVLVLFALLLARRRTPAPLTVVATTLLLLAWANLHSGFVLGSILIGAAVAGVLLSAWLSTGDARAQEFSRAKGLGLTLVLATLATVANPSGIEPHMAYFAAGEESPALAWVGDEWGPFRAFQVPSGTPPPSPLTWLLVWGVSIAALAIAVWFAVGRRRGNARAERLDPAWVALALVSLPAMWIAVRFVWLSIFVLLLSAAVLAPSMQRRSVLALVSVVAILTAAAFAPFGPWQSISRSLPGTTVYFERDYAPAKWFSHGVWFLKDAGLEGNLFNDYFMGGYLGFWLAPEIKAFQNGTLNVPVAAHQAMQALRARRGLPGGPSFAQLLDEYDVDLVFGIRLPEIQVGPWQHYTTALMERAPGWIPIFRNAQSSIYLRDDASNRANLERVAAYYQREGVPFDRATGLDPRAVLQSAPGFALKRAIAPIQFQRMQQLTHSETTAQVVNAANGLASFYAALGLYGEALEQDARVLRLRPGAIGPRSRTLWSLLRLDRRGELAVEVPLAESEADAHPQLARAVALARQYAGATDPEVRASIAALATYMTPSEARALRAVLPRPELREP